MKYGLGFYWRNMNNYYKVTSATIEATKRGYKLYKLQLDNSLWVTKLLPFDKLDQEYDPLYKIYEETNSLESLIGKYIVVSLISNKYGKSFNEPYSIDLINDFKKLLDKNGKSPFYTELPIYKFLYNRGYSMNLDYSINLKKPFEHYRISLIDDISIIYQEFKKENILTLSNLKIIYENFYANKSIETSNIDLNCKYICTPISIAKNCEMFHKYKSKVTSTSQVEVIKIGDELNPEQIKFLNNKTSNN